VRESDCGYAIVPPLPIENRMNKVAFEALIKKRTTKSLVSGDLEMELILRFMPTKEIENKLAELHKADEFVAVAIAEIK